MSQPITDRHPATTDLLRWFEYNHLPAGFVRDTSALFAALALDLVDALPDSAELTTGLRKLLEAKDCCVRAAVAAHATAPR